MVDRMERPSKRVKPNDYSSHNDQRDEYVDVQGYHNFSQPTATFSGVGVQNDHGSFSIGRDLIIHNNSSIHTSDREEEPKRQKVFEEQRGQERQKEKEERRRQKIFDSLRFEQMDARQQSIKKAHAKTCQWFLDTTEYKDWLDMSTPRNYTRFLWIKGKPGAGKSTLMRLVLDRTIQLLSTKDAFVLSFFFNARGNDLEKSTTGLYRSLLVQLLQASPDLRFLLNDVRVDHQWTIESLKRVFQEAVQSLHSSQLVCFIDALDECDEREIREMISFFNEFSLNDNVCVCFASRHYPHITTQNGLELILEKQEQHHQDISSHLSHTLYFEDDFTLAEQIRIDVQERSSSIFMWVVLVVNILNKEYDAGQKHTLRNQLQSIPRDLHDLLRDIITRGNEDNEEFLLCIRWILFAKTPLTPKQLYLAILCGLHPEYLIQCHSQEVSDNDIKRYLLNHSKGLAEATKSDFPTVQFIHESVRDFLLKENSLDGIWPGIGTNFGGQSHDTLKKSCLNYIETMGCSMQPSYEMTYSEITLQRQHLHTEFPLMDYSIFGLRYHADQAAQHEISQETFLRQIPKIAWVQQYNALQSDPSYRYSPTVSLLYILADNNYPSLIRQMKPEQSCFGVEEGRFGAPIIAALVANYHETVQVLLDVSLKWLDAKISNVRTPQAYVATIQEVRRKSEAMGPRFVYSPDRGVLSYLAEFGDWKLLMFFLSIEDFDIDSRDAQGRTPLSYAVEGSHSTVTRILIKYGADVNVASTSGWTPLCYASRSGHIRLVKLLLEYGANVDFLNIQQWSPLSYASERGDLNMVKYLLQHNAKADIADKQGWTPWYYASFAGAVEVVKVLHKYVKDINVVDTKKRSPLYHASKRGYIDLVKFLLRHNADVDTADEEGRTPLFHASKHRHVEVVRLLLEYGADVGTADEHGSPPLFWASVQSDSMVAGLLLKYGANANYIEAAGQTFLHRASMTGDIKMTKLLLEYGANVNAADEDGRTPLQCASRSGSMVAVRLLLKQGAYVHPTDKDGSTPLHEASKADNIEVARVLLKNGAYVNVIDGHGRTPLQYAAMYARVEIFKLLFEHGANPNTPDNDGRTPGDWACRNKEIKVFEI